MKSGYAKASFFIPFNINSLMLKCQKIVSNTLIKGKLSVESIYEATEIIKSYAERIDKLIAQKWFSKPDTKDPKVTVESYAKATGDGDQEVQAHTTVAMLEAGDTATLAIATAESYAATDTGETYVNNISGMTGGDTGTKHTYYEKGQNYEKALDVFIGIDWKSVYDREWVFNKHHSFHSRKKAEIKDGIKVAASNDAVVEVENYTDIKQSTVVELLEESTSAYAGQAIQVG
jgi:hypothetical protein